MALPKTLVSFGLGFLCSTALDGLILVGVFALGVVAGALLGIIF